MVALVSCDGDPMGLNSFYNKQLDSNITLKVARLNKEIQNAKAEDQKIHSAASKIDAKVRSFWTKINLYDACTQISKDADLYFDSCAARSNLGKDFFINLEGLDEKPEVILAIKKNEIKLLDHFLLEKTSGLTNSPN